MSLSYWYCNVPLDPSGPHSYAELVTLKENGVITPQTQISCDGKQYLSVEMALGADFLTLRSDMPKAEANSGIALTLQPEPAVDEAPRKVTALSILGLSARTVAHVGMIATMVMATWVWNIPGMKQINTRHSTNVCRMYLLQHWFPFAAGATILVLLTLSVLLWKTYNNEALERKVSWAHSLLALIAFLVPVTMAIAFVLGLIGDFILSLGSIG